MKQSVLLSRVKEYEHNPYRKEYEKKLNATCRKKPLSCHLINLGYLFFFVMFIFWSWVFFSNNNFITRKVDELFGGSFFLPLLVLLGLGIGNVLLGLYYLIQSFKWKEELISDYNKNAKKALDDEFEKKGLYHYPESELWKNKCCEYDDYLEKYVCCITKKPLSRPDYVFCSTLGKCYKCRTFMGAYLGEDYVINRQSETFEK